MEVQVGQSLWDSFAEHALVHGRAECESSYDVGLLLFPSLPSEPLCRPSWPLWISTRLSPVFFPSFKWRRTNLNSGLWLESDSWCIQPKDVFSGVVCHRPYTMWVLPIHPRAVLPQKTNKQIKQEHTFSDSCASYVPTYGSFPFN